ncbi:MEP1 (YGR121C) and MEP3 (YPR138C) [Zygosaccharomyces parabailii]|nr:MEP1 (YGR121C) and MEP3 (YPR138C) [Zygosaccharomyces parabailii]CDH08988.1 probable Ammonium transporter MEP3 [Zygosaccharomyces bailii ISA1307]SJM85407.1 probable Ammonium transporter MEP3 [Zygosaccharomyces bailii]
MHGLWKETYDGATLAFIVLGTACVFVMVPGLGFLYSGLARRKSALALIWAVVMATLVGIVQWYFWGYSLAFSNSAPNNKFIGNVNSFGFRNVYGKTSDDEVYPELAFAIFQGMFMCVTLSIVAGATAERGRLFPHMIFLFVFATVVYCPIAYWVWAPGGWCYQWGVLDWAGGGPVEIISAIGGFVYSIFLGRRKESLLINFRPHNVSMVTMGTSLLWFGWLLFNSATSLSPCLRSIYAFMNTNLSAATGGMTWCLLDFRLERKWSTVGLCSGIICGLVAATPSSGCITLYGSLIQGIVAGVICNFATKIKYYLKVDDAMDILAEHGIAGVVGLMFNALFAADWVIGMDGVTKHKGGWITHNYKQIYIQIAYIWAVIGYTAACTAVICFVLNLVPYTKLRVSEEAEARGLDEDQIGEFAYDYVEVRRDYYQWGPDSDNAPEVRTDATDVHQDGGERQDNDEHHGMEQSTTNTAASVNEAEKQVGSDGQGTESGQEQEHTATSSQEEG